MRLREPNKLFGVRQLGQAHEPISLMVAIKTLEFDERSDNFTNEGKAKVLLGIISRICKDAGKHPVQHTISTFQDKTMLICKKKVLIKQNFTASVKQFPAAVSMK
jgi:hypothetical protein